MRRRILIITILLAGFFAFDAQAQFRNSTTTSSNVSSITGPPGVGDGNLNNYNDSTSVEVDSLAGFSLKRMIRGYARKDTLTPGYMFAGAVIVPGAGQIYNRDWWKLPIVYGGIGAGVYGGIRFNRMYQESGDPRYKTYRNLSYIGAGVAYWASLLDAVASYKTDCPHPVPAKSTLYSALLPGLGQANNGDWWKIPIWVGGFAVCGYTLHLNDMEYKRFKYLYTIDNDSSSGYYGAITASKAEWYKDLYRKYRDYSVVSFIAVYALNIIDANVFAYMADFDVSDNIASLEVAPAIIEPAQPLFAAAPMQPPAVGLKLNLNF